MSYDNRWYFVTNYALVLIQVWQKPDSSVKWIADSVGITERAVHRILAALVQEGYVERRRKGRRNFYSVDPDRRMRHPKMAHLEVGQLFKVLNLDSGRS